MPVDLSNEGKRLPVDRPKEVPWSGSKEAQTASELIRKNAGAAQVAAGLNEPLWPLKANGKCVVPDRVKEKNGKDIMVTELPDRAFVRCIKLTSIALPPHMKAIGNYVFAGCVNLTAVRFPRSLKTIGRGAFADCVALTQLKLPATITNIGAMAFHKCTKLAEVELPAALEEVEPGTFSGCLALASVACPQGSRLITISDGAFQGCITLTELSLPSDTITKIGDRAFAGCTKLTNEFTNKLPSAIQLLGKAAFARCPEITNIGLPKEGLSHGSIRALMPVTMPLTAPRPAALQKGAVRRKKKVAPTTGSMGGPSRGWGGLRESSSGSARRSRPPRRERSRERCAQRRPISRSGSGQGPRRTRRCAALRKWGGSTTRSRQTSVYRTSSVRLRRFESEFCNFHHLVCPYSSPYHTTLGPSFHHDLLL